MDAKQVFDYGLLYHHYAKTAYPLTPGSFKNFRINNSSAIPGFLKAEWDKAKELSLYVHIPFCKVRCRFCEYAVLSDTDEATEDLYVSLLLKEIEMYKPLLSGKKIVGYDIGGGTPTKLSLQNLKKITNAITSSFEIDRDVVFSIETTPVIAAHEPDKIQEVFNMGYKRISMGIQTVSEKLLNELGREGTSHIYEQAALHIRKAGFEKFNIDLMYGFLHQSNDDFENTIRYAASLGPDYITLYRNRYKGTKLEKEAEGVSLYKIISQYRLAYNLLIENGYYANIGKNTFSKIKDDYGTSDYLTKRVINGTSYVGMGLGAQSFGQDYLAYNEGAASKHLAKYRQKIENGEFPVQDIYSLNNQETIGKMVSVAFYFGFIDFDAFRNRFGLEFQEYFKKEIDFVVQNGLMEIKDKRIWLTNRGSDYINGVIPLFYSEDSKLELSELFKKTPTRSDGETEFLKAYNIKDYERPSLATDIIVLSRKSELKPKDLSVVMIRRGEHPFMNDWALPGGFVKPDESVEAAAYRELYEEAGVKDISLEQLQVFSEPKRDPRGWIVSCSFIGMIKEEAPSLKFGEDAIDSRMFNIQYKIIGEFPNGANKNTKRKQIELKLTSDDLSLSAIVEKQTEFGLTGKKECYSIVESKGIAFDHAKILMFAMDKFNLQ